MSTSVSTSFSSDKLSFIFALLGSARVKAAHKHNDEIDSRKGTVTNSFSTFEEFNKAVANDSIALTTL